jgi:sulfate transport system substrate-binding protein
VPILDTGARGSTVTFVERGIGDVLLAWENEAFLATERLGKGQLEIVAPPESILAEPPVAVVEKVAKKHGTLESPRRTSSFLYSPQGQAIAAANFYRPRAKAALAKSAVKFPQLSCSPSTRSSAAGPKRRRATSPTAARSTRSMVSDRER